MWSHTLRRFLRSVRRCRSLLCASRLPAGVRKAKRKPKIVPYFGVRFVQPCSFLGTIHRACGSLPPLRQLCRCPPGMQQRWPSSCCVLQQNSSFPLRESEYHPPGQHCLCRGTGHHLPPGDSRFPHELEELKTTSSCVQARSGLIKANKNPQTEEKTTFCHCWHTDQNRTISCCSFSLFFTIAAVSLRRERQRARETASTRRHRC